MQRFSATEALRFGWTTFWKRPVLFVLFTAVLGVVSYAIGGDTQAHGAYELLTLLASMIVAVFLDMGATAFALKAYDDLENVSLIDLWHPDDFWHYVVASILVGIVVGIGLFLLVIPGVVAALALFFVKFLIIDKHLGPVDAFRESVRMTRGHRFELFVLCLLIALIYIVSALLFGIGLFVALPVTTLAAVYAYRVVSALPSPTRTV
jgi:uncharacterized membrane protein